MEGFRNRCRVPSCPDEGPGPDEREKGAVGYLSDTRKVKVIVHEDQAWANEVWIPLLVVPALTFWPGDSRRRDWANSWSRTSSNWTTTEGC